MLHKQYENQYSSRMLIIQLSTLYIRISKNKQKPTAVEIHTTETQHQGSIENFEVIGRERSRNKFHLKIRESLLIKKYAPTLNKQDSSIPLMLF